MQLDVNRNGLHMLGFSCRWNTSRSPNPFDCEIMKTLYLSSVLQTCNYNGSSSNFIELIILGPMPILKYSIVSGWKAYFNCSMKWIKVTTNKNEFPARSFLCVASCKLHFIRTNRNRERNFQHGRIQKTNSMEYNWQKPWIILLNSRAREHVRNSYF